MPLSAEQIAQQCDLELELLRGEITRAELVERSAALGIPVADYLLEPAQPRRHQPITITTEQLAERDRWEQMLKCGKITVDEALGMQMGLGVPVGDYTRQRYEGALADYNDGLFADLAVPLGADLAQRKKQVMARETLLSQVVDLVEFAHKLGFPKTNPSVKGADYYRESAGKKKKTAFHVVGEMFEKKIVFEKKVVSAVYGETLEKAVAFKMVETAIADGKPPKKKKSASTIFDLYHEALALTKKLEPK